MRVDLSRVFSAHLRSQSAVAVVAAGGFHETMSHLCAVSEAILLRTLLYDRSGSGFVNETRVTLRLHDGTREMGSAISKTGG